MTLDQLTTRNLQLLKVKHFDPNCISTQMLIFGKMCNRDFKLVSYSIFVLLKLRSVNKLQLDSQICRKI